MGVLPVSWVLSLLLGVLVVLAITAATGYFVAQEFAYMAVDRSRLNARAAAGDPAAKRALAVTRRTSFMLSGAQLGITVTGLLVGYVAEPLIGEAIGEALGVTGVPVGVGVAVGTVLALVFSTFVQMLFGELFPKNLAISRPEPVALSLATSTTWYLRIFGWLIHLFDQASNTLLRALKIEPVHDLEHAATQRDLEHIVADSRESGDLPEELSVLLDRILDFPGEDVAHAMVPRTRVGTVRSDQPVGEVRTEMSTGHSRYPVLDDEDEVVGVVHLQDLLRLDAAADRSAAELMRPALVVPTTMALPDVLARLGDSRNQLACVVDEYGGFAGVITLEDLAEELVGEITDEHDPDIPTAVPGGEDGMWLMGGEVHVDEVERAVGRDMPQGDYETIAGLVIAAHGSLPLIGTELRIELPPDPSDLALIQDPAPTYIQVDVLEIDRHVPSLVRIHLLPPSSDPADEVAPG